MKNKIIHTPIGVRDFLPSELAFKREIEDKIESVFKRYGFRRISSPGFEFIEVFEVAGKSDNIYKFIDDHGHVLALCPDMTPPIARIAATAYSPEDIPLRFSYIQNAYRCHEDYQGKLREFTQAGIELIGIRSSEAHAEIIAIAIDSLLEAGLVEFRIDIGQVTFCEGLLLESNLPEDCFAKIQGYIINRDFVSIENILSKYSVPENIAILLTDLPLLSGGKDILEKARKLTQSTNCHEALSHLETVYNILCEYGFEQYIAVDLSMLGHLDYYTGIIFRGYTYGVGTSVIDGGQYDNMLGLFGADFPAVGLSIKINYLLQAIEAINYVKPNVSPDILIIYAPEYRSTALKSAKKLRSQGCMVENSLLGYDIQKNLNYAKRKKIGKIACFDGPSKIRLISAESGNEMLITINELFEIFISASI